MLKLALTENNGQQFWCPFTPKPLFSYATTLKGKTIYNCHDGFTLS
jgi:hypothetical protein